MTSSALDPIHIIDADDWMIIYRAGQLAYQGHGGTYWSEAMALTGCAVHQLFLDGDNENYEISNLCFDPPQDLEAMIARISGSGRPTAFELIR